MHTGTFTFGSIARLTDYRSSLSAAAKSRQSKAEPIPTVSAQIPTGPVDSRTDQALLWSGLKSSKSKTDASQVLNFAGLTNSSTSSQFTAYQSPDLDLAYNFVTLQKAFSYREAVLARNPDAAASLGQNLSTQS